MMDNGFIRQITTFAAIFFLLVMAFDLIGGARLGGALLIRWGITTLVATGIYGLVTWILRRRKGRE